MARPSRSIAKVDYSGLEEPGGETQKISTPTVATAEPGALKLAPIFGGLPVPAAAASPPPQPTHAAATPLAKLISKPTKAAPKPSATKTTTKPKSSSSGLEMHRRALGDAVKANIHVEKWCIGASCHCTTRIGLDVFRSLVVPNAADVTPTQFEADTPVVVASVRGTPAAGEIFGKTKITGGTRMGSWSANKMELVFFPPTGELRIWWTMR